MVIICNFVIEVLSGIIIFRFVIVVSQYIFELKRQENSCIGGFGAKVRNTSLVKLFIPRC